MENGNYTLIDGDVEYGARVHYSCDPGYVINVEDNFLQCNVEQNWIGTIPTCTFVGTSGILTNGIPKFLSLQCCVH